MPEKSIQSTGVNNSAKLLALAPCRGDEAALGAAAEREAQLAARLEGLQAQMEAAAAAGDNAAAPRAPGASRDWQMRCNVRPCVCKAAAALQKVSMQGAFTCAMQVMACALPRNMPAHKASCIDAAQQTRRATEVCRVGMCGCLPVFAAVMDRHWLRFASEGGWLPSEPRNRQLLHD